MVAETGPDGGKSGPVARRILALTLLAHVLIFTRVSLMYAPELYLGPSGSDRVFYYSFTRSVVFDHDTDLTNEVAMLPPSSDLVIVDGKPVNKYPFGSPLIAIPAFGATHAVMRLVYPEAGLTGYERPYVLSYGLSQFAAAMVGLWLVYLAACRFLDPVYSAYGVAAASLGTELLRQSSVDVIQSHAASSMTVAACVLASLRLRERPNLAGRWALAGMVAACMLLTRLHNGVYLVVPVAAGVSALLTRRAIDGTALRLVGVAVGSGLLVLAPQVILWSSNATQVVPVVPGVATGYESELTFSWQRPNLVGLASHLAKWLPVLLLAQTASVWLAIKRRDLLLLSVPVATFGGLYVAATFWNGYAVWISPRTTFDNLLPSVLGLGLLAGSLGRKWAPAAWLTVIVAAAWNVPFLFDYPTGPFEGFPQALASWWSGVRLLGP